LAQFISISNSFFQVQGAEMLPLRLT